MAITDLYLTTLKDGTNRLDAGPEHDAIDRATIESVQVFSVDVPLNLVLVRGEDAHADPQIIVDGASRKDRVTMLVSRTDGLQTDHSYDFHAFQIEDASRIDLPVTDGRGAVAVVNGQKPDAKGHGFDEWDMASNTFWYRKIEAHTLEQHFERLHENAELIRINLEGDRFTLDGVVEFETLQAAKAAGDRYLRELGPEYGASQFLADMALSPDSWKATFENDGIYVQSEKFDEWMMVTGPNEVEIGSRGDSRTVEGPVRETIGRFAKGEISVDPTAPVFRPY